MSLKTILLLAAAASLTACVTADSRMTAGTAVASNDAAQIVDPSPAEGAPILDPVMAAAAIERYREDEVKDPYEGDGNQALVLGFTPGGGE